MDTNYKIVATNITTGVAALGSLGLSFLESNWPTICMLVLGAVSAWVNYRTLTNREIREHRKEEREIKEHELRIQELRLKTGKNNEVDLGIGAGAGTLGGGLVLVLASLLVDTEGGYVNHPNDPGGKTNYGITEKTLGSDPASISQDEAKDIYIQTYMDKPGFLPIIEDTPVLGYKLVDAGVNTGTKRSIRWFQTALNAFSRGGRDYRLIKVDGILGKASMASWEALKAKRGKVKACELIIKAIDAQQGIHYLNLSRGSSNSFTVGWFDHRIGNAPVEECSLTHQHTGVITP